MRSKWTLPALLGAVTFVLLTLLLWPDPTPMTQVVVANRDLGAGTLLRPADLTLVERPTTQAPADAADHLGLLVGRSLGVVRYAGEPVTLRHLGPVVLLEPDERGIAVKVQADTGLAGLLRPGMTVGVVATIEDRDGLLYAKALLSGLRVLYVPPTFQAQPETPMVYTADPSGNVQRSGRESQIDEGVVVLAASIQSSVVRYQLAEEGDEPSQEPAAGETDILSQILGQAAEGEQAEPKSVEAIPVELLAALNAADAAFTLVLEPREAADFSSKGVMVGDLLPGVGQTNDGVLR